MPSKGAVFASAVLAVLLLSGNQVSAEPYVAALATPSGADPADVEETIEYVEPEGRVHMYPSFHWKENGTFLLSGSLDNRSNADIPEAEIEIILPENSGLVFHEPLRAEPEQPPGSGALSDNRKSCTLFLRNFRSGEKLSFHAEGGQEGETEEMPKEFRTVLKLRGYGMVHNTEGMCDIPEYPEEKKDYFLSVRLLKSGKTMVSAPYTDLRNLNHELFMHNDEKYAQINMHYIPYISAEGESPGFLRNLIITLAFTFISIVGSYSLLRRILTDAAVRRDERLRKKKDKSGRLSQSG